MVGQGANGLVVGGHDHGCLSPQLLERLEDDAAASSVEMRGRLVEQHDGCPELHPHQHSTERESAQFAGAQQPGIQVSAAVKLESCEHRFGIRRRAFGPLAVS